MSSALPPSIRPSSQMVTDYFVCVICMERLNDPRMCRTCSKMWCRSCIEEWMRHGQRNCPHCRRQLNSEDIVKCRWVEELMRVIEGTLRQSAAPDASTSASSSSAAATLVPSVDISSLFPADMCAVHREVVSIYCRTCKSCICYRCAVFGEHKTHSFKPLEEVHEERVKLLRGKLGGVKKRLIDVTQLLEGVEQNQAHLRTARDERLSETRQALERIEAGFERELSEKTGILRNHACRLDREARCLRSLVRNTDELIAHYSKRQAIEKADEWIKELELAQLPSMRQFRVPYIRPDFPSPIFPAYDSATFVIGSFRSARTDARPLFSEPLNIRGVVWRLKVYPDGNGLVRGTHVSVFLELHGGLVGAQRTRYEYRIELCHQGRLADGSDADARLNYSRDCTSEFEINDSWGYNRFFELERIEREGYWHSASDAVKFRFYVRSPTYASKCDDLERYVRDVESANDGLQRTNRRLQVDIELLKNSQRISNVLQEQPQQARRTSASLSSARRSSAVISQNLDAGEAAGEPRSSFRTREIPRESASGDAEANEMLRMMDDIANSSSLDSIASMLLATDVHQNENNNNPEVPKTAPPRRRRLPVSASSPTGSGQLSLQGFVVVDGQRSNNVTTNRYGGRPSETIPMDNPQIARNRSLPTDCSATNNHSPNLMQSSLLGRLSFLRNARPRTVAAGPAVLPWEFLTTASGAVAASADTTETDWQVYGLQQRLRQRGSESEQIDMRRGEIQASLDYLTAAVTTHRANPGLNIVEASRDRLEASGGDSDTRHEQADDGTNSGEDDDRQQYVDYAVEQLMQSPSIISQQLSQQQRQRKSFNYDSNLTEIPSTSSGGSFAAMRALFRAPANELSASSSRAVAHTPVQAALPLSPPTRRSLAELSTSNAVAATPVAATGGVGNDEQARNESQNQSFIRDADNNPMLDGEMQPVEADADDVADAVAEQLMNLTFSMPSNDSSLSDVCNDDSPVENASSGGARNWSENRSAPQPPASATRQSYFQEVVDQPPENNVMEQFADNMQNVSLLADEVLLSSFAAEPAFTPTGNRDRNGESLTAAESRNIESSDARENGLENKNSVDRFSNEHESVTFGTRDSNDDVEADDDDDDSSTLAGDESDMYDDAGSSHNAVGNLNSTFADFFDAVSVTAGNNNDNLAQSEESRQNQSVAAGELNEDKKNDSEAGSSINNTSLLLSRLPQPSLLRKPATVMARTPVRNADSSGVDDQVKSTKNY